MTLLPRSLFGRLALLLLAVVAIALAATILFFRQDRISLLAKQFSDTKIVQLQAVRAALEANDTPERRGSLGRIGREYGVRIVPESERPGIGELPVPPPLQPVEARLREALGAGTEVRASPGRGLLLVRVEANGTGYWVGFPLNPRPQEDDHPSRAALWSAMLAAILLIAAFIFARYLARPLRELAGTVERIGRGETPPPLPESGPSEIVTLNRGVNRMAANLRQLEHDRAVLLAGVSHDLRTPLARLRLGVEMQARDEAARAGMVDDIEEMDRIIGQFLEFARTDEDTATRESANANAIVGACVERYTRMDKDVRFAPGDLPLVPLRPTAFSRLVTNLIDNALAYGAPPVEVSTRREGKAIVLDIADRGPGIAAGDVERLKQPFTRASAARTNAAGVAGAGLGLAIVDRIARLHGGTFDLLAREGGGTIARLTIPVPPWPEPPTASAAPAIRPA
jgi:two-component system osmolarity sensor histidine kinase EnvZ